MNNTKTFYYTFDKLNGWLVFNIVFAVVMLYGIVFCPCTLWWAETQILIVLCLFSIGAWCWKYLGHHQLALITDQSIKIDHCAPLNWKDIKSTEERVVRCGFGGYRVLILKPKANLKYKYNFLQKHNCGFTAFSLPLNRNISVADAEELVKIVKEKTGDGKTKTKTTSSKAKTKTKTAAAKTSKRK